MKIQIIGFSGSGKSTLARRLSAFYNIPRLHLDNVHFYGDWQERSQEEMDGIVRTFLSTHESWVIDGNYFSVAPERFSRTDLTICLRYPRLYCFLKCFQRYRKYKGSRREDCPCEEKFDREFRHWILVDGRAKQRVARQEAALRASPGEKLVFRNVRALSRWLKQLGCRN